MAQGISKIIPKGSTLLHASIAYGDRDAAEAFPMLAAYLKDAKRN